MSLYSETCLGCGTTMPPSLNGTNELVCAHCGCSRSEPKTKDPMPKRLAIVASVVLAVLIVAMRWGQFTFEAAPLQLKSYIGFASGADYGRLAHICKQMNDAKCVEAMLAEQAESGDEQSIKALAELGQVQFQLGKSELAVQTLQRYIFAGGDDTHAKFTYARSLAKMGQIDEATKQYEQIIASKPNVLMHTVTESYVQMLVKAGRTEDAKKLILATQKRGDNASGFMESHLRKIASIK